MVKEIVDLIDFVKVEDNSHVIDKDGIFDGQHQILTRKNCDIYNIAHPINVPKDYKLPNEILIKQTNVLVESKSKIVGTFFVQKKELGQKDFLESLGKLTLELTIPKMDDTTTRLVNYYWQQEDRHYAIAGMKMKIGVGHVKAKDFEMGNILSFVKFIENNFDEKSQYTFLNDVRPIFKKKREPINKFADKNSPFNPPPNSNPRFDKPFQFINLKANILDSAHAELATYKFFKHFFEKSKLNDKGEVERIKEKLPGYDEDITFETDYSSSKSN